VTVLLLIVNSKGLERKEEGRGREREEGRGEKREEGEGGRERGEVREEKE